MNSEIRDRVAATFFEASNSMIEDGEDVPTSTGVYRFLVYLLINLLEVRIIDQEGLAQVILDVADGVSEQTEH